MQAKVTLTWKKSASPDVVSQELKLSLSGVETVLVLDKDLEKHEFLCPELTVIKAELRAFDGVLFSPAALVEATIPDLTAPEAPMDFVLVFEAVP